MNGESNPNIAQVVDECSLELARAIETEPAMFDEVEGYLEIGGQFDELWEVVSADEPDRAKMRQLAAKVAAMAMRFMLDVCGGSANGEPTDPKD